MNSAYHRAPYAVDMYMLLQDLAVHTRVTPEQRKLTMIKFMQSVNGTPEARAELEKWGLLLENSVIEVRAAVLQYIQ